MKFILGTASLIALMGSIQTHSNMHSPQTRGNAEFWGYCSRGWGCQGACESPKDQSPFNNAYNAKTTIKRGQEIDVTWMRQNHPGGFVRLAMVPMDQSDDTSAFDQHVVKYVCYETNCQESSHDDMLGPLNGPGSSPCSTKLTVPDFLPDGPVTLQWMWYGGGVLFADQDASFGHYVSCSDMVIKGGNSYSPSQKKPVFQGGDVANPGANVCRYWSSSSVHQCQNGAETKDSCGYGPSQNGGPSDL